MKLSKILIIPLFFCMEISWIVFALVGERGLVNLTSLFLMSLLNAALIISLATATSRTAPIIIVWAVGMLAYFSTRFIALILVPEGILLGNRFFFGVEDMNRALIYLLPAIILTAAGFALGGNYAPSRIITRPNPNKYSSVLLNRIALIGIATVIFGYVGLLFFDVANFSSSELEAAAPWWYSMLSIFLNQDAACLLAIVITGEKWRTSSRSGRYLISVFFGLYVVELLLGGSRAALVRPLFWTLLYLLAKAGDIKFSRRRIMRWSLGVLIAVIGIFPVATAFKNAWNSGELRTEKRSFVEYALTNRSDFNMGDLLSQVSLQKAGLDTMIIIVNETGPEVSEYLSPTRQIKYAINKTLPGIDPFPEARFQTSRMFGLAYRGWSPEFIKQIYNSDLWTLWGLAYAQYGWVGGLFCVFIISFLLSRGYQWIKKKEWPSNLVWGVFMLSFIDNMLRSMGFDTDIIVYSHLGLSLVVIFAILFKPLRIAKINKIRLPV